MESNMKHIVNRKNFMDIVLLERFINNEVTENQFSLLFGELNESVSIESATKKLNGIFDWIIKNIKKIGTKIVTISSKIIKSFKSILPPKSFKYVVMMLIIIMVNVSFANVGTDSKDEVGNNKELVITDKEINESKSILNSAIGLLENILERSDDDHSELTQALGTLISIRDNLTPNNLDEEFYYYMSDNAKKMINIAIKQVKDDINNVAKLKGSDMGGILIKTLTTYKKSGEKLKSTVFYERNRLSLIHI